MQTKEFTVRSLDQSHREAALSLICEQFTKGSVLHHAMRISADEYNSHIQKSIDSAIDEKLSAAALDSESNEMLGCLIATEFTFEQADLSLLPDKFRPITALINELEEKYAQLREIKSGQIILVDLAIVSDAARGLGIYSKLRRSAHDVGRKRGFEYVIGELSSAATQHLCVAKLGHSIVADIGYADFEFEGSHPFEGIQDPPSIQLVEAKL